MTITDNDLVQLRLNPNQNKQAEDIKYNIGELRKSNRFTITKKKEIDLINFEEQIKKEVSQWKLYGIL